MNTRNWLLSERFPSSENRLTNEMMMKSERDENFSNKNGHKVKAIQIVQNE